MSIPVLMVFLHIDRNVLTLLMELTAQL